MARVTSGLSPWSEGYKRVTKRTLARQGVEWSLGSGYREIPKGSKPQKYKTKKIRLYNGRTVEVPDADFEDFIGHRASPSSDPYGDISQYIDKAFENLDRIQDVEGVGHITYIEYSPTYQLLRVEFGTDGAVVVFFRVPKEVYSELKHLATSGQTMISAVDGKQRHVLGMRFWDIIRIRGQREGSRYRYEYAIEGVRIGSKFERQMAAGRAEAATEKAHSLEEKEAMSRGKSADEELYDNFAKNMLSGSKLDSYNKLSTLKEKEAYLHKAGIL